MLTLDFGGQGGEPNKKLYPFNPIMLTLDVWGQEGEPNHKLYPSTTLC